MRRILETAGAFAESAWAWWSDLAAAASWPPALGPWLLALVALLLLAGLRRRTPPPLEVRPPQLLITQGEVLPESAPQGSPRRRRRPGEQPTAAAGRLTMTLSNLSRYPVQVLEVALRQESRGAPRVAELEAVVPPLGALELAVRVPLGLSGDGWLDVYCYAAAPRQKLHRHRAELVWEPWVARFKVAPMEQATVAARRLASDERNALFELSEPVPEAAPEVGPVAVLAATPAGPTTPVGATTPVGPGKPPEFATPPAGAEPGPRVPAARATKRSADRRAATTSDAGATGAGHDPEPAPEAPAPPATDATPLGALWARLPMSGAARGAGGAARGAGGAAPQVDRGDAEAPKTRPRLEFPDDF